MDTEEIPSAARESCAHLVDAAKNKLRLMQPETAESLSALLWRCVTNFEEIPLTTLTGLAFTYTIKRTRQGEKGNELRVSRKEKTISRSSVEMAFWTVLQIAEEQNALPVVMNGPKQLGTFGASYLYPLFIRFGLVTHVARKRRRKQKNNMKTQQESA